MVTVIFPLIEKGIHLQKVREYEAETSGKSLEGLNIGDEGEVLAIEGEGSLRIRLMEMGFVPGSSVTLIKRAPFGDPLQFSLRGYHLSLRKAEARRIRVRVIR